MRRRSKVFDNPLLVGIAALFVMLVMNAAVFNVPLIPATSANGQTVSLNLGVAGLPLLVLLAAVLLFMRVKKNG